ncbi:MAG: carbohydrate binding family 9 domain-containing protein, partial [bacterium]|nr:carbohydrate binding family 9 domain-containing protein [bacterium]
ALVTDKPKIDGNLDDAIWQNTEFQSDFLQREPEEGIPASEKTEVAILYDDDNLYIGARLYDSDPSGIKATEMRRDAMAWNDDYFSFVFDTFNDKRSGFYFTTNPLGVRIDGVFNDEGRNVNRDWDGVWSCKTSQDDKGWYLEIAIPWQTLRFKEGDGITWGANFIRKIHRKNESNYWRLVPREAGMFGSYRVSQAGRINNFNGLEMGGKFELLPYTSGWVERDDTMEDESGDAGIDVKWNISSNMTADFTYNTDFAQVEADQERVNNSRFSLFFPEKRDFFLEGAETFNFGQGGGGSFGRARSGNLQILHSRRIGITSGIPIPIMGGTRLYGKAKGYTYGLMSIQTKDHLEPADPDDEDDEDYYIPETNYSVFRLKKDVLSRSSIGLMVLNKELKGSSDFNRTWGIDSHFPITQTFSFYAVGAGTYSPGENKNNMSGNAGFNYSSDLWQYSLSYLNIEDDFNPEIGYIRRTDIKRTGARVAYSPRPKRFESIRKFNYQVSGHYQTDHVNRLLDREVKGEFRIEFENTSRFSINVERQFEFLDYDWDVRDGHTIYEGEYQITKYRASYSTPRTKALNGSFTLGGGDFYSGDQYGGHLRGDLRLFNRFIAGFSHNYSHITLPSGNFHTNTSSLRMTYSFNPDLFVKAYIQWYADTIQNSGKNKFLANILLRYIYRPGSDFYLVFNQQNLFGPNDELQPDIVSNRTVIAKFTYFFRK